MNAKQATRLNLKQIPQSRKNKLVWFLSFYLYPGFCPSQKAGAAWVHQFVILQKESHAVSRDYTLMTSNRADTEPEHKHENYIEQVCFWGFLATGQILVAHRTAARLSNLTPRPIQRTESHSFYCGALKCHCCFVYKAHLLSRQLKKKSQGQHEQVPD